MPPEDNPATSGAETAHPSETPEFADLFLLVFVRFVFMLSNYMSSRFYFLL